MKKILYIVLLSLSGLSISCNDQIKNREVLASEYDLRFNADGEFKIAQLTDIHWDNNADNCEETIDVIRNVLDTENPDLIILTGDIVCYEPAKEGWQAISKVISEYKIPWGVLMGNHDAEQDLTRQEIYDFLKGQPYYVGDIGPEEIHGTGNFILSIKSSVSEKNAAVIYCLDSNDYPQNTLTHGKYDWIRFDQIGWYRKNSQQFTNENGGVPLPSLAYFHIPTPEYNELIRNKEYYGVANEGVASSPQINSGFIASAVEMGDILATFVGHDHDNCFIGQRHGIALGYGRVSGLNAYGDLDRGARIVTLHEGKRQFDTWIRTKNGTSETYYYPSGITKEEEENSEYLGGSKLEAATPGIRYKYYEYEGKIKTAKELTNKNISSLKKEGIVQNFSLEPMDRKDYFGIEFTGWINIPEDGIYKFYTYTDDGSLLYINDKLVVDNDGSHSLRRADGRIGLKTGYHQIKLQYFESYMGEHVEVGISSKNIEEMIIPEEMLFH